MDLTPYFAPNYFPASYFPAVRKPIATTTDTTSERTPYNAPTYFAAAYFAGLAPNSPLPLVGRTPYNAPSYFASTYFPGSVTINLQPTPVLARTLMGRDGAAYADLIAILEDADEFTSVCFGDPSSRTVGSDVGPRAVVMPQGWEEADETDPTLLVRRASFVIRVTIRIADDVDPFGELDRLTQIVQARVDRANLGDSCLPGLTRIKAGRYQASDRYPEWSVDLDGEFSTLVDPMSD